MEDGGLSTAAEIVILAAFFVFVGAVGYFRVTLDREIARLPAEVRQRLDLLAPSRQEAETLGDDEIEARFQRSGAARRRRRKVADRLAIYGVPAWIPLSAEGRTALARLRLLMLGFLVVLAFGPALAFRSVWALYTLPVVLAVIGVRALMVGRWPEGPVGRNAS